MPPVFTPELVNDPFGDPGLFVDFRYEPRALLCDLGDLTPLPPKKILRISDVFVSHTHMDHFCGFDRLLRVCLGRDVRLRLFGPPGFGAQVCHKLEAYTWNLIERYPDDFVMEVWDVGGENHAQGIRLSSRRRFHAETAEPRPLPGGLLLDEPAFRVRAAVLDHGTVCLGFVIEEKAHVNVWKNRLTELGLPVGPWLSELREAVTCGAPADTSISVRWHDRDGEHSREFSVGWLSEQVLRIVPGEKIGYVTDVVWHEENARRITELAAEATRLYIECAFLDEDADQAARRFHLTARQAGTLARAVGAGVVIPFHFSPRYTGRDHELRAELEAARRSR